MADHLPLPSGRGLDSRRQRGGPVGGGQPPERADHSEELKQSLREVEERAGLSDNENDVFDPRLILKISASTRIADGPFRRMNFLVLGEGEDWTYAVLSDRQSRAVLEGILEEYADSPQEGPTLRPLNLVDAIDNIQGIELYGPEDRLDPELGELDFENPQVVDILLWPSDDENVAADRVSDVQNILESSAAAGGSAEILLTDDRPWTTLMRARVDRATLALLAREGWVERIRPPLSSPITMRDILGATAPSSIPPPTGDAVIGILDGVVVTANPLLTAHIWDSEQFPAGYVYGSTDTHGTAIASLAVWGSLDFVLSGGPAPTDSLAAYSARVMDIDPTNNKYVIAGIESQTFDEALRWLAGRGVKVVNISINRMYPETSIIRSPLTFTIDQLARELDLVVVVSAGNQYETPPASWFYGYPDYLLRAENEVTSPADCALGISVGAMARRDVPGAQPTALKVAVAPSGGPSPYTRTGPVKNHLRQGRAKPEFSHDGGNVVYDKGTDTASWEDPGVSVPVATPPFGGQLLSTESGTSPSAALVTHEIGRIHRRYPQASANTLRAISALSSRRTEPVALSGFDVIRGSIYGVPDADRVLESGGPRAILTVEAAMPTGSIIVHDLPVPYEFREGRSSRSLRVALAFDPPVRRTRREYIAGSMTVELVRGLTFEEVSDHYGRQPTVSQAANDPSLIRRPLPPRNLRPALYPGVQRLAANTLIRQDYVDQTWDPDLDNYFLVVTHTQAAWSARQRREYSSQSYSLAVELAENDRQDLDLHNLVRAEIQARADARIRLRT